MKINNPKLSKILFTLSVQAITVFCLTSPVNAQIVVPEVETVGGEATQFLQQCNQIINAAKANPNDANLQIYARNCWLRLQQYQICLNQGALSVPPDVNFAAKCANANLRF